MLQPAMRKKTVYDAWQQMMQSVIDKTRLVIEGENIRQ